MKGLASPIIVGKAHERKLMRLVEPHEEHVGG